MIPDVHALEDILRSSPVLMSALEAARDVAAPDWLLSAGAIRDAVWDARHGRPPSLPRDLDVGFFDPDDLSPARDEQVVAALRARAPDLPWDAKNQAAVHRWFPGRFGIDVPPFRSTAEAVATFPETASCVGVRLRDDGELLVVAPHGLDDLLGCVCRHNPARVSARLYEHRLRRKGWRERWPLLRVLPPVARVTRSPTPVLCVEAADEASAIRLAMERLERTLGSLRGRHLLGAVEGDRYLACVRRADGDDASALGLVERILAGGDYLRARLRGEPPGLYAEIPRAVALLEGAGQTDARRPILELYRRWDVVDVLVPVTPRFPRAADPSSSPTGRRAAGARSPGGRRHAV